MKFNYFKSVACYFSVSIKKQLSLRLKSMNIVKIGLLFLFNAYTIRSMAQEIEHAPRTYSLETSYKYLASSEIDSIARSAISVEGNVGWQMSGYLKKRRIFLSIPLGYQVLLPSQRQSQGGGVLFYGVKVLHELTKRKDKKITPWAGYNLLTNQLFLKEHRGRIIGHETRSEVGIFINTKTNLRYKVGLGYSISSYGILDQQAIKIHGVNLRCGVQF